jgi:NADPH-dependent 2,4-dienoyl-CoA reductase/sulfur reductase-like enzyme/rhodanese-related sulfurtransferase
MNMTENHSINIIVVGASAAGLRAAARARRRLPDAKILVIDQGSFISYAGCGMPYFVSGDIQGVDNLRTTPYGAIRDADFFREAKGLEVLTGTKVERIDRDARKVYSKSMKTGETSVYSYDKLVLATGARPIVPPGVPVDDKRITTFRSLEDAISLRKSLETGKIEKVGIVGAGLIGCELAEAFSALWGAKVVLIDAAPNILPGLLDPEMALAVEAYLKSEKVEIHTNCPFEDVTRSAETVTIRTAQTDFEVDCAVVAVGVRPNSELAAGCGLVIGKTGGVVVDDRMATSDPNIFAAGDCIEVKHLIAGKSINLPLGSLANRQGRIIGSNLGGGNERFGPVVGSAAVKLFDMNIAATGLMETLARDAGFNVGCVWGTFTDRADYYPEAQNIYLKLVFDRQSGRLLGLQGYGKGEVVKRIDVFSALLKNEGKLEDLMDMEFAYAPPYAPAVDALYVLACIARDAVLEGIQPIAPDSRYDEMVVIDLRRPDELKAAPLPEKDILTIPFEEIRRRWEEIPKDKPLICICAKGVRSAESMRFLKEKGFSDTAYLGGGCLMRSEG